MAFKRVDRINQRVRYAIGQAKMATPTPHVILDAMDSAQLEMSERGLAIKDDRDFLTEAGTEVYDLGTKIFQLDSFVVPVDWTNGLEIITDNDVWNSKAVYATGAIPRYARVWNERLWLRPVPTVTGIKLHVFMYLHPSKKLDLGQDPEVSEKWDKCLEYGTLKNLLVPNFFELFEKELSRMDFQEAKEIAGGAHTVQSFTDGIGY